MIRAGNLYIQETYITSFLLEETGEDHGYNLQFINILELPNYRGDVVYYNLRIRLIDGKEHIKKFKFPTFWAGRFEEELELSLAGKIEDTSLGIFDLYAFIDRITEQYCKETDKIKIAERFESKQLYN